MNTYTATITARGADSYALDRAGAVDADIHHHGALVGSATLVPDHEGRLTRWGELGNWADWTLQEHLDRVPDRVLATDEIVEAVRASALSDHGHSGIAAKRLRIALRARTGAARRAMRTAGLVTARMATRHGIGRVRLGALAALRLSARDLVRVGPRHPGCRGGMP